MKHFLILISVGFLLVACKSTTVVMNNDDPNQNIIPNPSKNDVIMASSSNSKKNSLITSLELNETVSYLSSDELLGRNTGTEGIAKAAMYIEKKFNKHGIQPYFETYLDSFKVGDKNAYNVVGFLEGQNANLKEELIIIGAHYDHIGYGKAVENDSIANGANDNAAGTSAVLAMAKYFSENKSNGRSLMFVLFSAEEMGLLGSKHLAGKLKAEEVNLYTMLNFEMIGVPFTDRDYEVFITGYDLSNMASKINEYVGSNLVGFSEIAKQYQLFRASDNHPFYEAFKLPSQTISSCDLSNYNFYHHVHDEADKLDYNHMASLINKIIPAIEVMSNTPTKEIVLYED
ncbi:M28 family peptidase [Xanthomarina spongicola]|uniref:Peptidase M28-like protein n=1 Tax=Xanthomarina spongicola TaxID=570520 RepID=A0A316DJF9_9FLAO|nr:M28 family peptidase [Xanthomarina spongicola]PWK18261.1 peptidase M28-like protein [Xanthomarina spongicola]